MKMLARILLLSVAVFALTVGCAFAQNRQSDREFKGLKGKVKTVQMEVADATMKAGKVTTWNRRKEQYSTFSQGGSASTDTLFFWNGREVLEADTYFQVDGDKVSTSKVAANVITTKIDLGDKPSKPADPRYEFKYKYKYDDQQRIVEEAWWQNTGELYLRYVFEYAPGEKRESKFDNKGALIEKFVYRLDPKGNVSETIWYDVDSGKIHAKDRYKYLLFDKQGNWTKRLEYETEEDNVAKFKISAVGYRTITYYQ
jgi:hypothetical protein